MRPDKGEPLRRAGENDVSLAPAAATSFAPARCPGWLAALGLVAGTAFLGPLLGSLARPVFVAGCLGVGLYAWRRSPCDHLQTILLLFSVAPLLRRLVDLSAGFDPNGLMLVGPLLTVVACAGHLVHLLDRHSPWPAALPPIVAVGCCVIYAAALSIIEGDWINAASGALKWLAPLVYAAVLAQRPAEPEAMISAAADAFALILPVMGLYGIVQYVDPPAWDRYWMQSATMTSIGQPIPYGVRTFSTMNAPASFATFTAAGMLLIFFLRANWLTVLMAVPAMLALLLSSYRTAWVSLIVGVLFCTGFEATRKRALAMIGIVMAGLVLVAVATPFGDTVGDRLASFSEGAQDGSVRERLQEFVTMWTQDDSVLFGHGFNNTDVGTAGAMLVDGTVVACWISMGIVVGLVCLAGLVWAASRPIAVAARVRTKPAIVAGALACGALSQMPLSSVASAELGVLFWTFAVLLPTDAPRPARQAAA